MNENGENETNEPKDPTISALRRAAVKLRRKIDRQAAEETKTGQADAAGWRRIAEGLIECLALAAFQLEAQEDRITHLEQLVQHQADEAVRKLLGPDVLDGDDDE